MAEPLKQKLLKLIHVFLF